MRAERRHTAACYRRPPANKARLRAVAARHIAEHGLDGFNLHQLAPQAGLKFDLARWYYRTNQALIADIIRNHQAAIGEALTEPLLAARSLPGPARMEAVATALLDAPTLHRDGHHAAMAATAALPTIAETARRGDLWLHGVLAEVLEATIPELAEHITERDILARSLLILLEQWALRLDDADAGTRAMCATLAVRMVLHAGDRGEAERTHLAPLSAALQARGRGRGEGVPPAEI
jgi:hypothetical protein